MKQALLFTMTEGVWNKYPTPWACVEKGMPYIIQHPDTKQYKTETWWADTPTIFLALSDSFLERWAPNEPMYWLVEYSCTDSFSSVIGK